MESEPGRAEGVQFFWGLFAQEQDENDKIQLQSCKQTKPQQLDKKKDINRGLYLGEPGRVERVRRKQMQNLKGAN